ncbi:MAG: hypothetical protein HRT77_12855 [Halioglobus sp.]|nr:hypothetical protein [Halioglobus sp.]
MDVSDFQLTRSHLEQRDIASDRAALTRRIEAYRYLEPCGGQPLIVAEDKGAVPTDAVIPEVVVADLTVDRLREAMSVHGGLIIRNLFNGPEIEALKHAIDQVLGVFDLPRKQRNQMATPYFNPPENMASIMPEKEEELAALRYFNGAGGGAMCVEAPCVAEALLQLYEKYGVKKWVADYLGENPVLSVKKWMLRRSTLPIAESGWHQDGAFMGTDINSINLWIPLSDCGGLTGAPGMDIVPKRLYSIGSAEGASFDWSVSDEIVQGGAFGVQPVAPEFSAGDAFFFDHMYLHRTQAGVNFDKVRYAIETWFFGSTTFPKSQVPIAW